MTNILDKDNALFENNNNNDIIKETPSDEKKERKKREKKVKTPEEIAEAQAKKREYHIEYFEKNKDKLKSKVVCEYCGRSYMQYNKGRHEQTRTHKNGILITKLTNDIEMVKRELLK